VGTFDSSAKKLIFEVLLQEIQALKRPPNCDK